MDSFAITGLGVGTVFISLIALAIIVSLFPLVFQGKGKQLAGPAPLPSISSTAQGSPGTGSELVAVIAAAIAASTGMSPGSFSIATVESRGSGGFNTPVWGHVDRITRSSFTA